MNNKTEQDVRALEKRITKLEKVVQQLVLQNKRFVILEKRQRTTIDRLQDQVQALLSKD